MSKLKVYKDAPQKFCSMELESVDNEIAAQYRKWGHQSQTLVEWLMHTTEELGELSEAIADYEYGRIEGSRKRILEEAVQVAALATHIMAVVRQGEIVEE